MEVLVLHRGNSTYLPEPVEGQEEGVAQDLFLPPTQTRQLVNDLRTGKVEGTAWGKREGWFRTHQSPTELKCWQQLYQGYQLNVRIHWSMQEHFHDSCSVIVYSLFKINKIMLLLKYNKTVNMQNTCFNTQQFSSYSFTATCLMPFHKQVSTVCGPPLKNHYRWWPNSIKI